MDLSKFVFCRRIRYLKNGEGLRVQRVRKLNLFFLITIQQTPLQLQLQLQWHTRDHTLHPHHQSQHNTTTHPKQS